MTASLDTMARAMVQSALALYRDHPRAAAWLRGHLDRLDEPLRIAVAGPQRAGTSTLVNALVGDELAPIELADGSAVPTWYRDGPEPGASVHRIGGGQQEIPVGRRGRRLHADLRSWRSHQVERIVVRWPARALRDIVVIDVPSTTEATSPALAEADAVLLLTRHPPGDELSALRAAQDRPAARAMPVSTILVLSRADEIGGGRIDALSSAKQIARRYRADLGVGPWAQSVVAVTGLVAQAGRTLREPEFAALTGLAAVPRADLEQALLSVDRFTAAGLPVEPTVRAELLERFGLFGLRLSTALIRQGYHTQTRLAAQLVQRSGLSELREAIGLYLVDRAPALKARSALLALDTVLRAEPRPSAGKLAVDLERLLANAHEFRELRLLAALQVGRTKLPAEWGAEAQQLIGADGEDLPERLGLDHEASAVDLEDAVLHFLYRWREQAENPLLNSDQRAAARVVVRSCEGMLARLPR